jgi:acetoin utilization protein AcuB
MLQAKEIMQKKLRTLSKDSTISEAIELLVGYGITGLPVVDDDMMVVGIVSEKDLLNMAYHIMAGKGDATLKNKKVADIMTTDVVSFKTTSNVADICLCLMDGSFRRVPIVEDNKLVGIISKKDIIYKTFEKI